MYNGYLYSIGICVQVCHVPLEIYYTLKGLAGHTKNRSVAGIKTTEAPIKVPYAGKQACHHHLAAPVFLSKVSQVPLGYIDSIRQAAWSYSFQAQHSMIRSIQDNFGQNQVLRAEIAKYCLYHHENRLFVETLFLPVSHPYDKCPLMPHKKASSFGSRF